MRPRRIKDFCFSRWLIAKSLDAIVRFLGEASSAFRPGDRQCTVQKISSARRRTLGAQKVTTLRRCPWRRVGKSRGRQRRRPLRSERRARNWRGQRVRQAVSSAACCFDEGNRAATHRPMCALPVQASMRRKASIGTALALGRRQNIGVEASRECALALHKVGLGAEQDTRGVGRLALAEPPLAANSSTHAVSCVDSTEGIQT